MNSKERKVARYERRKAERTHKKQIRSLKYDNINNVASLKNLYVSAKQSTKGVRWKTSIQRYDYNRLYYITKSRQDILNHKKVTKGFICFNLYERGKARSIKAVKIEERVIQKTLCRCVLLPYLKDSLIYDNGACLKGRGTDFAIKRCTKHLVDYYKRYGTNQGWILQFDIKSYFDSIPTTQLCEMLKKEVNDENIKNLIEQFILAFKKYGENGIGLGSEISQICAVYYLNKLDHYAKEVLSVKPYNRYMDDGYAIFRTKEEATSALEQFRAIVERLGIKFNPKKTHISKLEKGFSFLKVRFILKPNGKVVKIINSKRMTRERRKLKKFKSFVDEGTMSIDDVCSQVQSVVGSTKGFKNYHARLGLKNKFDYLFKDYERTLNINGKCRNTNTSTTS